ncbi:hypothetical protein MRI28_18765, partial [Nocardiopsis dassonvillei]|uniref:hypothetical protein n=1 Tax=Nocardiopsis dassonvillei TaxID=2014 RepID=UPI00200ECC2C
MTLSRVIFRSVTISSAAPLGLVVPPIKEVVLRSSDTTPENRPFALLTVTCRPEDKGSLVGLTFHTGPLGQDEPPIEVTCYAYEDQAPILSVRRGGTYMHLTPADPNTVGRDDLRVAKALVEMALRYYQELHG